MGFCDKAFKGRTNLKAHIRRTHRLPDGSLPAGAGQDSQAHSDFGQEYPIEGQPGGMMDPNHPDLQSHPGPGKKKGRPKKVDQQQARPIGQVTPAPRPSNDGMKNIHEQARPPVQQDRGASPMMSQSGSSQMGQNMGNKGRPGMQPRGIMGPGMRP